MKIRWLNAERTSARLSKWRWFRRLTTFVERTGYDKWSYAATGEAVEEWLARGLEWRRIRERVEDDRREHERRNWAPSREVPAARVLERK